MSTQTKAKARRAVVAAVAVFLVAMGLGASLRAGDIPYGNYGFQQLGGSGGGVPSASPTFTGVATFGGNNAVAAAGATQGTATLLASTYNVVTTATINQGVILPSPLFSAPITVVNNSGVVIDIYPPVGGSFGGMSANAPMIVPTGFQAYTMFPLSATVWSVSVGFGIATGNYRPTVKLNASESLLIQDSAGGTSYEFQANGQLRLPTSGIQTHSTLRIDMTSVTSANEIVGAANAGGSIVFGTTAVGLNLKSGASTTANPAIGINAQVSGAGDLVRWQKNGTTVATLDTNGYLLHLDAIIAKAVDYTATAADHTIVVDASGAARVITLPAAASHTGRVITVKKTDASGNTVTIDGDAAETIDGAATQVLSAQYALKSVQSDGATWWVVAQ